MAERFVSFAELLVPAPAEVTCVEATCDELVSVEPLAAGLVAGAVPETGGYVREMLREVALLRVAAAEAYERAAEGMLERLAREVLGRELQVAPVDLAALVRAMLEDARGDEPVALLVASGEALSFDPGIPVRSDPALRPGDLILLVRDGCIDARLDLRLADLRAAS